MSPRARHAVLAFALAVLVIGADQWLKRWLLGPFHLADVSPAAVWGPLRLTLVHNNGVSFGFFQSQAPWTRWALAAFSAAVTAALAVWAFRAHRGLTAVAIGLIMGGAVGNLVDRIVRGAVVDFIDVTALHFPWVFNIADSAISVGIALLLLENLLTPRAPGAEARA